MRLVTCLLTLASLPLGALAVASCGSGTSTPTTDGGSGSKSNSLGTCSVNHSDAVTAGAYDSAAGLLVLGEDCRVCTPNSNDATWTSTWNADRSAIVVDVHRADGTTTRAQYVVRGTSVDENGVRGARLSHNAPPACGGVTTRGWVTVGTLDWARVSSDATTWVEAQNACTTLDVEGGGWRLPTRDEMLSITAADVDGRTFGEDGWFWTSTDGQDVSEAWAMTNGGAMNANRKATRALVRCVR